MEKFKWEKTKDGTIRLLGVNDTPSEVIVPNAIEGLPVTEVGPYCFARNKYLERVVLPDSIIKIEHMAFYHCTALRELEIGPNLLELGADAFMNCYRLHELRVHCGAMEKSGVRLILHQISHDLLVHFTGGKRCNDGSDTAKLLFTEYYETYDEVAPAHLFGRNIEGEGFRTRQCFKDGIIEYKRYDMTFKKACAEEKEETLCALAMNRLQYPIGLSNEAMEQYFEYVGEHLNCVCQTIVIARESNTLEFLCEKRIMTKVALEQAACLAAECDWAEGTAFILRLKAQYFKENTNKNRYSFDDF